MHQSANRILMIRPHGFRMNEETAVNNFYQDRNNKSVETAELALREFDGLVKELASHHVDVYVWDDPNALDTPDNLFPNNWISFHDQNRVVLYPMFAENRRRERNPAIIQSLFPGKDSLKILDLSKHESNAQFLEGTGSLVLDRINKIAYAAISPRTHVDLVSDWCDRMGFKPILFHAYQSAEGNRLPIYHTNVMMSIGTSFASVCPDCIDDEAERNDVLNSLRKLKKEIIILTEDQINEFAGNMLEIRNSKNESLIVMSTRAYNSLDQEQKNQLNRFGTIVHSSLEVIEKFGGGSARCMLAEVF